MGLRLRGGAWYFRRNVGGKRVEVPLGIYGGAATRAKAVKAAAKVAETLRDAHVTSKVMKRMGIDTPKPAVVGDAVTLASWWKRYQDAYSPAKAKRTQKADEQRMVHWLPLFEGMPLADIRQIDCVKALNIRRKAKQANPGRKAPTTITESTVQRERRFIQAVFERAVENGVIDKNPWRGIKGKADPSRSDRILTDADEAKLLEVLTAERPDAVGRQVAMHPRYVRFVQFMLETGLRLDELLNEHFTDQGTSVRVRGKFGKTRNVALTARARLVLTAQWADPDRPETLAQHPWWQNEQRFREVLRRASERAGIPHLSPHDLRHTFGCRYLRKGGDIYTLSKMLGHASVAVTEKHYGFMTKDDVSAKMLAVMDPKPKLALVAG